MDLPPKHSFWYVGWCFVRRVPDSLPPYDYKSAKTFRKSNSFHLEFPTNGMRTSAETWNPAKYSWNQCQQISWINIIVVSFVSVLSKELCSIVIRGAIGMCPLFFVQFNILLNLKILSFDFILFIFLMWRFIGAIFPAILRLSSCHVATKVCFVYFDRISRFWLQFNLAFNNNWAKKATWAAK